LERGEGGGSRFNELAQHWASRGHTVQVVAGMVHYNTGKKLARYAGKYTYTEKWGEGIDMLRCHVSESYNTSFTGRLWGYFSFVVSSIWGSLTQLKGGYDVILVTSPPLFVGVTGLLLKRAFQIPLVFEIRDLWPESAIDTGVLKSGLLIKLAYAFEAAMYKAASRINVLTPAFAKVLVEKKGIAPSKIIQIPNAADFSLSESIKSTFDRDTFRNVHSWGGQFVAIYVGAHGLANHLQQLIDAAEHLNNTADGRKVLIVCIGDGMQRSQLIKESEERALNNIRFIAPVSKADVFAYILAADCGLSVLKRAETFKTVYSNKTFDYMACGKPIVLGIDGVSRELIEQAECGIFAEPEDGKQLADALLTYSKDPERCEKDGLAGYNYARAKFDRAVLADVYLKELERVIAEN
jgi:glycosyltransferase involved in cell wall biosynthesis